MLNIKLSVFGTTSQGGYRLDYLKSALQKAVRRGDDKLGQLFLRQISSIIQLEDPEKLKQYMKINTTIKEANAHTRLKAIKTNILNRFVVIMSQDIGIAESTLPIQVKQILSDTQRQFPQKIAELLKLMLTTKKTRFISECRSYWLVPPFLEDNFKQIFHTALRNQHPQIQKECKCFEKCFLPGAQYIKNFSEQDQVASTLLHFWKKSTVKQKPIHLIHAKLVKLFSDLQGYFEFQTRHLEQVKNKTYDFINDRHVGKSEKGDPFFKTQLFFALEASRVDNELLIYKVPEEDSKEEQDRFPVSIAFRHFYILTKIFGDISPQKITVKRLQEIKSLPLMQKRTGKGKKFVYFDKSKIVKGPYSFKQKTFWNALNYSLLFLLVQKFTFNLRTVSAFPPYMIQFYDEQNLYLMFKNVGKNEVDDKFIQKDVKSGVDQSFSFIERKAVVNRASEVQKELTKEQLKRCAIHLYLRYIFNIGDSGLHNILVCQNQIIRYENQGQKEEQGDEGEEEEKHSMRVVGIDVEQNRGESDYFVKSKKEEELLKPLLKQIPIIEELDPLSREFMHAIRVSEEAVLMKNKKFKEKFIE